MTSRDVDLPADRTAEVEPTCPGMSIVVCTHNRSCELRELLDLLGPQIVADAAEVVVVDSASSPDHADRVRSSVEAMPGCRLMRLETPGLSIARNAGLGAARAPWVAFLDDDEIPRRDWVQEALRLAQRLPADCAVCGGNITLHCPNGDLQRLSPRWLHYLSAVARRGEFDQTATPRLPIGHSLVRAEAVRAVGGFDARLGRINGTLLSGEEVLLLEVLRAAGWTLWHSDRIEVAHRIGPERLTRAWVLNRSFWEGVTTFRVLQIHDARQLWLRAASMTLKWPLLCLAVLVRGEGDDLDLRLAFAKGYLKTWISFIRRGQLEEIA